MRIEQATITPEQATDILARSKSVHQRTLVTSRVNQLVAAIVGGQFRATHQPIALDPKGYLIDGQHRLTAIATAGIPVEVTVAYDVDPSTFDVIDTGRARTPGDTLKMAGIPDGNVVAAAARMLLVADHIGGTRQGISGSTRGVYTSHDILELAENPRGTMLRRHVADGVRIGSGLGRAGIRTWLAAALTLIEESGADDSLRAEFTDRLETGALLPLTSPILAWRKWVSGDTGYTRLNKAHSSIIAMGVTLKTWNDWLNGRERATILFRLGDEVFPVAQQGKWAEPLDIEPVPVDDTPVAVPA